MFYCFRLTRRLSTCEGTGVDCEVLGGGNVFPKTGHREASTVTSVRGRNK